MNNRTLAPTPELTWRVATAIHQRCCTHSGCSGAYQHLGEAAAAVDALLAPRRTKPVSDRGWPAPQAA